MTTTTDDTTPVPYVLTPAALLTLNDPEVPMTTDDPMRLTVIPAVHDEQIAAAMARVDLLLDEAVLTLSRAGYLTGDAAEEVSERLEPAAARVRARLALQAREGRR